VTLDANQWGNPEIIIMRRQEYAIQRQANMDRVCAGCVYKKILFVGEEKVKACAYKRGWAPSLYCNYKQLEKE